MVREALFYLVILLTNIIQGITGFAGTILAMPFGIMLVGGDTARPILNVLGLLSGIYVFAGNRKYVDWKECRKIIGVMTVGILAGMCIRSGFAGREQLLYGILGVFVLFLAVQGLAKLVRTALHERAAAIPEAQRIAPEPGTVPESAPVPEKQSFRSWLLLGGAGIAHGMFVCGGPLLIGYLAQRLKDKNVFRATISTVWIVLNGIILVSDSIGGCWNGERLRMQLMAVPFLLAGMAVGGWLYKAMNQRVFMTITYLLLLISGILLLVK